jgi:outer membrane protein assembly factor BamB
MTRQMISPFSRRAVLLSFCALAGCTTVSSIFNGDIFDDWFGDNKTPMPGHRESVSLSGTPSDALLHDASPVVLPPATINPEWSQPGGNARHAMGNLALSGKLTQAWTANIGEGAGYRDKITAQPLVSGDQVFTMDSDGNVRAFGLADGRRQWETSTQAEDDRSTNVGGGISVDGGIVYAATGRAELLAIDAHGGAIKWRVPLGTPARSGPTIADGRLFVPTLDNRLIAFSAADGKQSWVYQGTAAATSVLGDASPACANGVVVAGFGSGDLVALRADSGTVVWTDTLAPIGGRNSLIDFSAVRGLPVIDSGRVFAIGLGGLTVSIDLPSGRRLWERQLGGSSTPWLAGDTLFIITNDQQMIALARDTGATRWATDLPRYGRPEKLRNPLFWMGPVLVNDRLIAAGTNKQTVSVNPLDGTIMGTHDLTAAAALPPMVAAGKVFLTSIDSTLLALN